MSEKKHNDSKKKKQINSNREIIVLTYLFVGVFVCLLVYFGYFIQIDSPNVINNPYNKRQDLLAERVIRGKILGNNGEILAETKTDESGKEYRYYPFDRVFCHIVGRFDKGKTGIELSQSIHLLTSNENPFIAMMKEIKGEKNIGDNVVTTLDVNLQTIAYEALGNRKGAVVVLEPSTGKILAMVSKSDYNPNTVSSSWDTLVADSAGESTLLNRATQGLYPPGSTFKILTALEYIRENKNYKEYTYDCAGSDTYDGVTINCYNNKVHGTEDLIQSFAKSCNSSFANIGMTLNLKSYHILCESFLFNHELPIDLPYSKSSFVLDQNSNKNQVPQTAIGQGDTQITPLHNALITATIANNGIMMKPYVVDHLECYDGTTIKQYKPEEYATLMDKTQVKALKKMMKAVVEDGTATALKGQSYTAAGKTGSAEFDSSKSSHAWFVGYAPTKKPKIVVSIIVEGAGTGSAYAVPIAKKIMDAYLD
ncbi:MAG: peptidoglycan D,D-transpeptidase FtsI family protein [Velocimicrobium sp.]